MQSQLLPNPDKKKRTTDRHKECIGCMATVNQLTLGQKCISCMATVNQLTLGQKCIGCVATVN